MPARKKRAQWEPDRCQVETLRGTRCRLPVIPGKPWCRVHDRRQGGRSTGMSQARLERLAAGTTDTKDCNRPG